VFVCVSGQKMCVYVYSKRCVYMFVDVCVCVCVFFCVCVCMCLYVYILCTYLCICTHIHPPTHTGDALLQMEAVVMLAVILLIIKSCSY